MAQVFRHPWRVTYADCTVGNHVYYSRYLDYLEAARGEFLRHLGQPLLLWQERDILLPVVECRLRYRAAARYDDALAVEVWLSELARVRLTFAYRIVNPNDAEILAATTLHACTSASDKLKRLPDDLRSLLQPFLKAD